LLLVEQGRLSVAASVKASLFVDGTDGARGALALYAEAADNFTLDEARIAAAAAVHLSRALRAAGNSPGATRRSHAA
jgi:hypothetical protein